MPRKHRPIDLSKLKTYSIGKRSHKFDVSRLAGLPRKGASFRRWLESLPPFLGAEALAKLVVAIVQARRAGRPVVFAMGAHPIKVGCSPIICDLIRRGIVSAVAMNGATAIHDFETAAFGQTSEEVADTIRDGRFGMVRETPAFFAEAVRRAGSGVQGLCERGLCERGLGKRGLGEQGRGKQRLREQGLGERGLGEAIGEHLLRTRPPYGAYSILATAKRAGIPATVHVAIGTDTIHMHEEVAGSRLFELSAVDFRLICGVVAELGPSRRGRPSGVWCNIGSAVVLPEVFLKAVAVARNLGSDLDDITTANLDMIRHYRPGENVIGRPVRKGRGHQIVGHHEILLPMLRQAIIEAL